MPTIHLRGGGTSVVLTTHEPGRLPVVTYWGADLGDLTEHDREELARATVPPMPPSSPDVPLLVELVPQAAHDYPGRWIVSGTAPERRAAIALTAERVDDVSGGVDIHAVDPLAELDTRTEVRLDAYGVLRMRHRLTNTGRTPYDVLALPLALPVPQSAGEVLDLTGRWSRERTPQRIGVGRGAWVHEGRHGRPGHDSPLLLVAGPPGFDWGHGEVWGVHLAWSGNAVHGLERLPEGPCLLGAGELLEPGEVTLEPAATYETPWLVAVHSAEGLDGLSDRLHRYLRARPGHPTSPRKVVVNTWEAVYFDHDRARLDRVAELAAEVGVERLVVDDGWFGARRDETAGLGDWEVSADAWPEGLAAFIERVHSLGLDFGLWVEPEMVNLDSDLARAHPDWLLTLPERRPSSWRHEWPLDLTSADAFEHVLTRLDVLLTEHDIAFVKWDHNRDLVDAHSAGVPAVHAQTVAAYDLLDQLRARHPGVEFESCASGGGRVDLGILERTERVWPSDCTDAHERQQVQRWTQLLVPPELVGAHVSAPANHQTGRVLDLSFRAGTALFGHFGIEWDLASASADERAELAAWVRLYRERRDLLHSGRVVRRGPDDGRLVHGVVA
ncbi:MAG: alpha-galactosidase, partial [Nocardioides sp.]